MDKKNEKQVNRKQSLRVKSYMQKKDYMLVLRNKIVHV